MEYEIREASPEDYQELIRLYAQEDELHIAARPDIFRRTDGPARTLDYVRNLISEPTSNIFVASQHGGLRGFLSLTIHKSTVLPVVIPKTIAIVEDVVVDRVSRREGIGRSLMLEAKQWCIRKNVQSIELFAHEFNRDAISFYEGLGFTTRLRRMSLPI